MMLLGIALLALMMELVLGLFYFFVLSVAFAAGGCIQLLLGISLTGALSVTGVLSILGIVLVYSYQKRKMVKPFLSDDYDIGQLVVVKDLLGDNLVSVMYKGVVWQASLEAIDQGEVGKSLVGQRAKIKGKQGNTLLIELV